MKMKKTAKKEILTLIESKKYVNREEIERRSSYKERTITATISRLVKDGKVRKVPNLNDMRKAFYVLVE